jgi:hypothetical protein
LNFSPFFLCTQVPFNALKQLTVDEIKPWVIPYHARCPRYNSSVYKRLPLRRRWSYYKHIESYDDIDDAKNHHQQIMYPSAITYKQTSSAASDMVLKQYTSTQHFQPPPYEQYVMPYVIEPNAKNTKSLTEGQASQNPNNNNNTEKKNYNKASGNNQQNNNNNYNKNNQDDCKDKNDNTGHQQPQQQQQQLQHNQPPQQPTADMPPSFSAPVMAYNNSGTSYFYPTYGYPSTPNEQPYYYEQPMIAAAPQYGATNYYGAGVPQPTGQVSTYGALPTVSPYYTAPPPPPNQQHQPMPYAYTVAGSTMTAPMVNTSSALTPISGECVCELKFLSNLNFIFFSLHSPTYHPTKRWQGNDQLFSISKCCCKWF